MHDGEVRCSHKLHGIVRDGRFEVKCSSARCGAGRGVVVLHYFDLLEGKLIETRKFRDPSQTFEGRNQKEASAQCH